MISFITESIDEKYAVGKLHGTAYASVNFVCVHPGNFPGGKVITPGVE